MIYIIIITGILFVVVAFAVTEKNARYILSGYNTLSEGERKHFDLVRYIPFFKNFHLFLGASILLLGIPLHFLVGEKASAGFLAVYPIVAYIYFLKENRKFSKGKALKGQKAGIILLLFCLLFVLLILGLGFSGKL